MKVSSLSSFLNAFPSALRCFILYGNNEPLLYFREKVIASFLKKTLPFARLHYLDDFILPETASTGLFESIPSDLIFIYQKLSDKILPSIQSYIQQNTTPYYLILSSSTLSYKSKAVEFALKHPSIAAIPCYENDPQDIAFVMNRFCHENNVTFPLEIKNYLRERLLHNPTSYEHQLQKVALFLSSSETLDIKTLSNLLMTKEEGDLFKMREAFFQGNHKKFIQAWLALKQDEFQDIGLIRFFQGEAYKALKESSSSYQAKSSLPALKAASLLTLLIHLEIKLKWASDLPEDYLLHSLLQWSYPKSRATK